jgi:hypothetical protein
MFEVYSPGFLRMFGKTRVDLDEVLRLTDPQQ